MGYVRIIFSSLSRTLLVKDLHKILEMLKITNHCRKNTTLL